MMLHSIASNCCGVGDIPHYETKHCHQVVMKKKHQQLNTAKAQPQHDTTMTKIKHGSGRAQHFKFTSGR